jgi:predicted house-cleaning noncanonical NTP pyrophosphatase (MazG superfamily)
MDVKAYNKLIRDNIPQIIEAQGKRCVTRVLSEQDFIGELRGKLSEEVSEYLSSGEAEELADILEVVYALSDLSGPSKDALEELRLKKRAKNGGFEKRVYLESVITG